MPSLLDTDLIASNSDTSEASNVVSNNRNARCAKLRRILTGHVPDPPIKIGTRPGVVQPRLLVRLWWWCFDGEGVVSAHPRPLGVLMIGDYERVGVVARGAHSTIWKGFDPGLKRDGGTQAAVGF